MVLNVLWDVMQHSLKTFQTYANHGEPFILEESLISILLIKTIPISFLSFYRILRLEMSQIQKVALRDTFHRSCEFYVQISMSLILTRSFYQEQLRNVESLVFLLSMFTMREYILFYISWLMLNEICFTWW